MRITGLGLQTDLNRKLLHVCGGEPAAGGLGTDAQHVLLVDGEIHIDRVHRDDGRELSWRGDADEFADRDHVSADDAVERRGHVGVAVVDLGELGVGLGLLEIGLRVIARRCRGVERGLRDGLALHQLSLPFVVGFRLPD